MRKTMKMLLVAAVATGVFAPGAEAAQKKTVRHRARHSSRVSSNTSASASGAVKRPAGNRRVLSAPHHRSSTKPR
jgi:hypothetical protein